MRLALKMMILFCLLLAPLRATGQKAELGVISSPRSAGIALLLSGKGENRSLIRTYVDLYKVIDGTCETPGYKVDYHMLYRVCDRKFSDDFSLNLSAGPGAAAGYVHDKGKNRGLGLGLSGAFIMALEFRSVTLAAGISAILGCHVSSSRLHDKTLDFYKNGVYQSYIPEITISYRF
ncbi:MAG: hypothetical protein ACI3ZC_04535 [Candidatus Cryptobacteroides sp.]